MGKGLLWLRDNLTEVNLGNRVAVDRKALGGRIRLEGRCGGAEHGRLGRQWGAMNVNFCEPGKDTISCHGHSLGGLSPSLN